MKTISYQQAEFLTSAYSLHQLPRDADREVAFAGRSNSGKSSVINTLTNRKRLAKTSRTPGRTRLINIFSITPGIRLVDLPGYGYAKVPGQLQKHWSDLLTGYLERRKSLCGLILITDIRRGLTPTDMELLEWCRLYSLPVHVLLNKMDKVSGNAARQAYMETSRRLDWQEVTVQLFSTPKRTGIEELKTRLDDWLC